jgi:hypothetical protein
MTRIAGGERTTEALSAEEWYDALDREFGLRYDVE